MPFTDAERQEIVAQCTRFLAGRPVLTFAERMREIADSEYAQRPIDNYGNGGFITEFEQELADLMGKEAAVFMPSGTMAQQIAVRIWCDQTGNNRIAYHPTSHLEIHEQNAYRELHHLEADLLGEPNRLFTLDDLKSLSRKPGVLLIELPQREIGGQLPTWDELTAITTWARENGIRLHLDGARLWECRPFYQREYHEIAALFDSVYVSFYKILGGLPGAMLFGPSDFIAESRIWLRRHGGNLHTQAPNAIAAKIGLDRELPRIAEYCRHAAAIAEALRGLPNLTVVPEHPPTNMMHWHIIGDKVQIEDRLYQVAKDTGVLLFRWLGATVLSDVWKVEVSIATRALEISPSEIRQLMERVVD